MRRDAPTIRAAVVVRPRLVSYLLPSSRWVGNQAFSDWQAGVDPSLHAAT